MGNNTSSSSSSEAREEDLVFAAEFSDAEIGMDKFDFIKPIAHGGFGEVFLTRDRSTGTVYALKVMDKAHVVKHGMVDQAMAEKAIQLHIGDSPFVVNLRAAFQTADKLCIVMDYVSGGDLFECLKLATQFSEPRARLYAAEVVCALEYLHSRCILYRDLKLENVLLDEDGHVLLCDFGLAKQLVSTDGDGDVSVGSVLETVFCGTKEYMAPEMLTGSSKGYGFAVDWWAFGVFLYAMVTGKYPFYARTAAKLEAKIVNDAVWFPPRLSPDCRDLIEKLLIKDPAQRISLDEVKEHSFFADLDWARVHARDYSPEFLPEVDEAIASLRAGAAGSAAPPASQPIGIASSGTGELTESAHTTGPDGEVIASWVANSPSMSSLRAAQTTAEAALEERRANEAAVANAAITECRKILPDETFIQGWVIISINKWNFEQTRVLLLTADALYRVKYDFGSGSAEVGFDHAARTPLEDIIEVQRGRLYDSRFSNLTGALKPPTLFSLRIVSLSENLRRTTKARTFCPFMTPSGNSDADLVAQEELTDMIVGTILAARENLLGPDAALSPDHVEMYRETLSNPRIKPLAKAPAPNSRVRELATQLANVNQQIADMTQALADLHTLRDGIRSQLDAVTLDENGDS